ncbi:MAG TPA: hypothetical protein VJN95_04665 [Gemmatimonadales bacterium]|nr:hypothetical protein [Gemmatimonadales bacterium]
MIDPPDNRGFMVAGYTVALTLYLLYTISLWIRARKAERGER